MDDRTTDGTEATELSSSIRIGEAVVISWSEEFAEAL